MKTPIFRVIKPGMQTTVQDLGRNGFREFGVSLSGAMDSYSLQMGNLLVGNELCEAGLEAPIIGPALLALTDVSIAICGGNLTPMIDESEIPLWKSMVIKKGQTLSFGQIKEGSRSYICIAGGINVPSVLNSKSTYLTGKFGGYKGRALKVGDILFGNPVIRRNRYLDNHLIPVYQKHISVRVVLGPHKDKFTSFGIKTFLNEPYILSPQSNRMGCVLMGPKVQHRGGADIISDPIPLGGIQIPASGQPIILMAEHQTTGGYTRIGTVISTDIPFLAQALPGSEIRFSETSLLSAQKELIENRRRINCLHMVSRY
ncbi:biotin-dependent carboxyltransferase family protein [Neobacillus vireti]|uniref:5-oxoprolinase subunit C family protein n=1 Tax=Neobacillus vireti TaxID=220686 RepID=UPI002FFDA5AC